jgi:RNA 2',3'-cyclic 3'-phosphodiesterase
MGPNWFIALPVQAVQLPSECLQAVPVGLSRFHPDDLHVTVAFLGPVDASSALAAWYAATLLPAPDFHVSITGMRALGSPARPSAYGLVLDDGAGSLNTYIAAHRDALREAAGVHTRERPPLPHVTLARPPRKAGQVARERAAQWLETFRPPPTCLQLDRLALYTRSRRSRSGNHPDRRFRRVAEYPAR